MLSAGTNVQWLVEDLGLIESPAQSHDLAASVASSDGVVYVPALLGLGTPNWDFGARGTLLGVTRGTTAAHVVRAVLDGVAQRARRPRRGGRGRRRPDHRRRCGSTAG